MCTSPCEGRQSVGSSVWGLGTYLLIYSFTLLTYLLHFSYSLTLLTYPTHLSYSHTLPTYPTHPTQAPYSPYSITLLTLLTQLTCLTHLPYSYTNPSEWNTTHAHTGRSSVRPVPDVPRGGIHVRATKMSLVSWVISVFHTKGPLTLLNYPTHLPCSLFLLSYHTHLLYSPYSPYSLTILTFSNHLRYSLTLHTYSTQTNSSEWNTTHAHTGRSSVRPVPDVPRGGIHVRASKMSLVSCVHSAFHTKGPPTSRHILICDKHYVRFLNVTMRSYIGAVQRG